MAKDRMLAKMIRQYGRANALAFCRNIGISFEDCYFMMFGREARK